MQDNLKEKSYAAVRWNIVGFAAVVVFQLIQVFILGRLLAPEDFGLMGMALAVITVGTVFTQLELTSAVIQRENPGKDELSSLYWLSVFCGVVVCAAVFAAKPLIALLFNEPRLEPLLVPVALSFFIASWGTQFTTLLSKHLRFREITTGRLWEYAVALVVSTTLALLGYGVWALVIGHVFRTAAFMLYVVYVARGLGWFPALHFKFSETKSYLSFGLYRTGSSFLVQCNNQIDQILIGALLGAETLGFYNLAWRLTVQPMLRMNGVLAGVAFPVFSKVQDDASRLRRGFLKMMSVIAGANTPLLLLSAVTAGVYVPLLLGDKWLPSVHIIQALAFTVVFNALITAASTLVVAKGLVKRGLHFNIIQAIALPSVILPVIMLTGSVIAVCVSMAVLYIVFFVVHYRMFIAEIFPGVGRAFFQATLMPVGVGICTVPVMLLPLCTMDTHPLPALFLQACLGMLCFLLLLRIVMPGLLVDAAEMLPGKIKLKISGLLNYSRS